VIAGIKPGVYLVLQMGQEEIQLRTWPVIARELVRPDEYFIFAKSEYFWGSGSRWVSKQEQVNVSGIERTILDGFFKGTS